MPTEPQKRLCYICGRVAFLDGFIIALCAGCADWLEKAPRLG